MTYTPREYWSAVAEEVERRPGQSLTAGDDSPAGVNGNGIGKAELTDARGYLSDLRVGV